MKKIFTLKTSFLPLLLMIPRFWIPDTQKKYKSTRNRRKSRMLINELKIDPLSSIDKAGYNIFQDKCINFKFH